jgi:hypothetical protein
MFVYTQDDIYPFNEIDAKSFSLASIDLLIRWSQRLTERGISGLWINNFPTNQSKASIER